MTATKLCGADECRGRVVALGYCALHYQRLKKTGDHLGLLTERSRPPALDLPTERAAYLAGLIDGEGYVGISVARGSKSAKGCVGLESHRLTLSVRMTDRRPLEAAASWTGYARVRIKRASVEGHRVPYEWIVWSRQAASVLVAVRPHLLVKREQADLALEFQSLMRAPGRDGLSGFEWAERRRLAAAIRSFNYGKDNIK